MKLKSAEVNYNREGKSNGTATVGFTRRQDALRAMQEYNGGQLDGKPMQLAMVRPHRPFPIPIGPLK